MAFVREREYPRGHVPKRPIPADQLKLLAESAGVRRIDEKLLDDLDNLQNNMIYSYGRDTWTSPGFIAIRSAFFGLTRVSRKQPEEDLSSDHVSRALLKIQNKLRYQMGRNTLAKTMQTIFKDIFEMVRTNNLNYRDYSMRKSLQTRHD